MQIAAPWCEVLRDGKLARIWERLKGLVFRVSSQFEQQHKRLDELRLVRYF